MRSAGVRVTVSLAAALAGIVLMLPVLGEDAAGVEAESAWQAMMRSDTSGYALPDPGRELRFPADHLAHPDFALEWWYLTANLEDAEGRRFGLQWTLFRSRVAPAVDGTGWRSPQLWLAHAALGDATRHRSDEKRGRGGIGVAVVEGSPFRAWIDDWAWTASGGDPFPARLRFDIAGDAIDLRLDANGPYVLQGEAGFSVKNAAGTLASHYYSQPFVTLAGTIDWKGEQRAVSGQGWFDREWSSQFLDDQHAGWDWFSLHLDGGRRLMLFQVRGVGAPDYRHGNWIEADGTSTPIDGSAITLSPLETRQIDDRIYPVRWSLRIDAMDLDIKTRPLNEDSLMRVGVPYWEGAVSVDGSHTGRGFLEMTGY